MTEQEWLTCTDPKPMLEFLSGTASDRKLRLFAVSCCRHNLQTMLDVRRRKAVDVAELFADGLATEEERKAAHLAVDPIWGESEAFAVWASAAPVQVDAICAVQRPTWINQSFLVRDIFGNPFDSSAIVSDWLKPTLIRLARTMYDDRSFTNMPALADALEEVGCTNANILNHCRQPGEHVRGCWIVDLILGKH